MKTPRKIPLLTGLVATLALASMGWAQAQPAGPGAGPMMGPHHGGPMAGPAAAAPGADMQPGGRHMMMRTMGMGHGPMAHGPMAPGMQPGTMVHERMLDRVGASAEQKTKIREIYRAAHADIAKTHEAQRDLHRQMAALMTAPQVDAAAAEALRQKMSAGHDAVSKRMLQAQLDAGAVLTPEQRQKLSAHMAQRRELRDRHLRERQQLEQPRG